MADDPVWGTASEARVGDVVEVRSKRLGIYRGVFGDAGRDSNAYTVTMDDGTVRNGHYSSGAEMRVIVRGAERDEKAASGARPSEASAELEAGTDSGDDLPAADPDGWMLPIRGETGDVVEVRSPRLGSYTGIFVREADKFRVFLADGSEDVRHGSLTGTPLRIRVLHAQLTTRHDDAALAMAARAWHATQACGGAGAGSSASLPPAAPAVVDPAQDDVVESGGNLPLSGGPGGSGGDLPNAAGNCGSACAGCARADALERRLAIVESQLGDMQRMMQAAARVFGGDDRRRR